MGADCKNPEPCVNDLAKIGVFVVNTRKYRDGSKDGLKCGCLSLGFWKDRSGASGKGISPRELTNKATETVYMARTMTVGGGLVIVIAIASSETSHQCMSVSDGSDGSGL